MSEGYILNTLQSPAVLRPVYDAVEQGSVTTDQIQDATGLSDDAIAQGIGGLHLLRVLGREDEEFYTTDFAWDLEDDELAFRMTLLHNLARECTPGDWGKQAVVLLNYQYLLQEDIQHFENDDAALYGHINEWHRTEKGYVPHSQQGEIDLNKHKFVNWSRIISYLGLVHKATGREHTVYPDPSIVRTSITLALEEAGEEQRIELQAYLSWLRKNLFPVELGADGSVPAPLGRILYNLVRDEDIRLVEYGDAGAVPLVRTPSRDGIATDANTIEVVDS